MTKHLMSLYLLMATTLCAQAQNTFPVTGFVGIGTTSPQQRLHVEGSSNNAIFVSTSSLSTTSGSGMIGYAKALPTTAGQRLGYFLFGSRGGAQNSYNTAGVVGYAGGAWSGISRPAYLSFETTAPGTIARAERVRIDPNGNVGIGTATPAQKLQVAGSADFSGDIYLGGNRFLTRGPGTAGGNTLVGEGSGAAISSGVNNSALGSLALFKNTAGSYNSAFGLQALAANEGHNNTALGALAMTSNTAGSANVAVGVYSLGVTRFSSNNTAVGVRAGANYDNGWNNVFIGANTDVIESGYFNVIAIGQGAICTAPSQVTIGNPSTTSYRAYAGWSDISDGRFKQDVQELVPGLSFISKLRPVTYRLKAAALDEFLNSSRTKGNEVSTQAREVMKTALKEKETRVQTGFVAQEVEHAAKELGYNFSGVETPANDGDVYALRYSEFVVPLVKAVQELDAAIKRRDERINKLEEENTAIKKQLAELKGSH